MSADAKARERDSFVLLQVGDRRFALPARIVAELAPPVRLQHFPHRSPLLAGVIVRRGRIVPVYDAGPVLIGANPPCASLLSDRAARVRQTRRDERDPRGRRMRTGYRRTAAADADDPALCLGKLTLPARSGWTCSISKLLVAARSPSRDHVHDAEVQP